MLDYMLGPYPFGVLFDPANPLPLPTHCPACGQAYKGPETDGRNVGVTEATQLHCCLCTLGYAEALQVANELRQRIAAQLQVGTRYVPHCSRRR